MYNTTFILLGILLGTCALIYELATGLRRLERRLDRIAEHLDPKSK